MKGVNTSQDVIFVELLARCCEFRQNSRRFGKASGVRPPVLRSVPVA
jgi:hypothetical protein